MLKYIVLLGLLVAFVAGCGGPSVPSSNLTRNWRILYVPYEGGTLRCIQHDSGSSALPFSCDFDAFYKARKDNQ